MFLLLQSGHRMRVRTCVLVQCCYAGHYYYTVIVHLKPSFVCSGQCSSRADVTVTHR